VTGGVREASEEIEDIEEIEEIGAGERDADGDVGAEATSGSGTGSLTGTIGKRRRGVTADNSMETSPGREVSFCPANDQPPCIHPPSDGPSLGLRFLTFTPWHLPGTNIAG
jgi:hypothetical protein